MDNIIVIKNKEYFKADDVLKNAPVFCKGCRNGRELIKKKNIKDADFTYAIESNNKWKVVDGSNKKLHKLLIQKDWIIENVDEYNEDKREELNLAPEIIYLEDEEKFCDNDGNILDIEVRGEKEHNKCYFKVKDIMEGFKINDLNKNILNPKSNFNENEEYKYLNCKKVNNKIKKEMFLTFNGFKKLIESSRNNRFDSNTKIVLHNWLKQFDKKICTRFIINKNNLEKIKNGYVYLVTSDIVNFIKIGYWRSTIDSLKSRYITTYGNNVEIFYVDTKDASLLEKQCHTHFNNKRITNELFKKEFYDEYKSFLLENKIEYKKINNDNDNIEFIDSEYVNGTKLIENYKYYYYYDTHKFTMFDNITVIYNNETYFVKFDDIKEFINDIHNIDYSSDLRVTYDKKEMFLTYNGLLRVLFASHSKTASKFVDWATKTLFTAQMGTEKQKNKLIADIKGVSYEAVKESFNALATDFPCVYLITLNTVKDLRKSMDIDDKYNDEDIVCKFGLSKDFNKRMNGHAQEFKSIKNKINLSVKYYSFIDPLFISKAETEIKELLSDYSFEWNNMKEIIIINKNLFKTVKTFYENMAMKYSGHASGLNEKIKDLEVQIEKKNNEIVLLKKQHENDLLEKDRIIDAERHAKELLEKDLKIAELEKDNLERKLDVANKKIKNLKK